MILCIFACFDIDIFIGYFYRFKNIWINTDWTWKKVHNNESSESLCLLWILTSLLINLCIPIIYKLPAIRFIVWISLLEGIIYLLHTRSICYLIWQAAHWSYLAIASNVRGTSIRLSRGNMVSAITSTIHLKTNMVVCDVFKIVKPGCVAGFV